MTQRFTYIGSVFLFLIEDGKILLQRRANTGFMDGWYGVPSGHLDGGETAREGGAREFREEIGIIVKPEDLTIVEVMHRKADRDERIDFFMTARAYEGTIENKEPEKCDDLAWFPLEALPENMIDYIKAALEAYQRGEQYAEFGW
ncbi:MAG TPA: NUDIX domain-containing protein [Candidatus Paceibacterota bacterium]|nr:NUDIX domain-containing protein [Candidatus Paceibacterota bacterium]